MKIELIGKIPINETQLNQTKPVYIEISKPLEVISTGNFGPPYYEDTTRLEDITIYLLEKEKNFVFKLPNMKDPDPDEIQVIL